MKRHVYHYHAFIYRNSSRTDMDGVVLLENRVTNGEQFRFVKKLIADGSSSSVPVEGLILSSLSYLGLEEE